MDCAQCRARKATVHVTEVVGNKEKCELHLCQHCCPAVEPQDIVRLMEWFGRPSRECEPDDDLGPRS
jgi:hypothetical protein